MINPSVGCGSLDHRVFAADVVSRHWKVSTGTYGNDHVQVGHRRLDHDHVCTLGDIGVDLDEGLTGVAPILLVALAVATTDNLDVNCVAEWAV